MGVAARPFSTKKPNGRFMSLRAEETICRFFALQRHIVSFPLKNRRHNRIGGALLYGTIAS
ncbi:hypothetical protein HMPREF0083_04976 [Aneurinibacillus aneurinilyticus ATCC 12856]|uniref:Uncharacterized protein n=1 Tax=Aneurinibacillus aneurinilyticus ATCC 12856 TaxID=649747 RepID=U1Y444_ANEAE|nr:hypothetical protein HMPREF0083_04976 [Aneurinibacillus aneurinilyticus ATCC 12856]